MTLWFENSYGYWRPICDCANKIDVGIAIRKFLDEHHFDSHYIRTWTSDGFVHYDVGSWSEFFHWQVDSTAKLPDKILKEDK